MRCPLGGWAPCVDDLCHGVDTLVCGLALDFDVCAHGFLPELCQEYGCRDDEDRPYDDDE